MCLQFGFVFFWQKAFGAKAAHKMLVKLTPGDVILTQLACPLNDVIFCLHWEYLTYLSTNIDIKLFVLSICFLYLWKCFHVTP